MNDKEKEVGEIIDRLATIYDEEDEREDTIQNEISALGKRLYELTGKTIEECEPFRAYWSYTELGSVVKRILMPKIEKKNLSENELIDIITKLCNDMDKIDEAELDQLLEVLKIETGLSDISDYFFYPEAVGLNENADNNEIIKKILSDRYTKVMIIEPEGE